MADKVKLSEKEEIEFQKWYKKVATKKGLDSNPDDPKQYYDYRAFYKNEPNLRNAILTEDKEAHFTDKYKLPGHPTFSDESIYSNEKTPGGKWEQKNGKWVFNHSSYTAKHAERTNEYLKGTGEIAINPNSKQIMPDKSIKERLRTDADLRAKVYALKTARPDDTLMNGKVIKKATVEEVAEHIIKNKVDVPSITKETKKAYDDYKSRSTALEKKNDPYGLSVFESPEKRELKTAQKDFLSDIARIKSKIPPATPKKEAGKNIDAEAQSFITAYKANKSGDIYSYMQKLHAEKGWNDQELDKFQKSVSSLAAKETGKGATAANPPTKPSNATSPVTTSKTGSRIAAKASGKPERLYTVKNNQYVYSDDNWQTWYDEKTGKLAGSASGQPDQTAQTDPDPTKAGQTSKPAIQQQTTETPKEADPKGVPDGVTLANKTADAETAKQPGYKPGIGEALGAAQIGLGLAGANKYSKLSEKLVKEFPMDQIPLEATKAYEDSEAAKTVALNRARQGLSSAQKAEIEAKIENTAAANLSTEANTLGRSLGVKAKYDALLGMASMDESVRSENEQKYLAFLQGANQQAAHMSAIKRQLYEDRRLKWENQYQRALMGEQAGAQLLQAGISNVANIVQMKEIEAMKKPNVFNITPQ